LPNWRSRGDRCELMADTALEIMYSGGRHLLQRKEPEVH